MGSGFFSYSRGMFLPALAENLADGSRMSISIGFSFAAIVGAAVSPALGKFLDEHSPRLVLLLGIGIVTVSYLALANVGTLWQFYLIVGVGFGLGMTFMGGMTWHRNVFFWFDHWRGRAIAIAVMGSSLAGIMMPPLVTYIVDTYGWRLAYLSFAASTAVILLPVVYFFLKDRPADVGEVRDGRRYVSTHTAEMVEDKSDSRIWTWQQLLGNTAFWSIGLIFGAQFCVFGVVMLHMFGHLLDIGLSSTQGALVLSVTAFFAAFGKPVVGVVSDFWGARVGIWMSLICQALALLLFAHADTYALSIAAAGLYGFGYSGMSPLRSFAISTSVGSQSFALATGVLRWVELPFVLVSSPLAGFIYDATGSYNLAFLVLCGLLLVACIGPLFIKVGGARERRRLQAQQGDA